MCIGGKCICCLDSICANVPLQMTCTLKRDHRFLNVPLQWRLFPSVQLGSPFYFKHLQRTFSSCLYRRPMHLALPHKVYNSCQFVQILVTFFYFVVLACACVFMHGWMDGWLDFDRSKRSTEARGEQEGPTGTSAHVMLAPGTAVRSARPSTRPTINTSTVRK